MKYGIFGVTSKPSEVAQDSELTIESMVMAEAAFDEAAELAHEAEVEAISIAQAVNVAEHMDQQAVLGTEAAQHPEMINSLSVALARESMVMATVALGGTCDAEEVITTESMTSAPVESMEVTTEGFKSRTKSIYEGIKILFKKIGLTMKKMAAKLVVAMDSTGKKAEKMLKNLKAMSKAVAKETKLSEKDSKKLNKSMGGYLGLRSAGSAFETPAQMMESLEKNMKALAVMGKDIAEDSQILSEAMQSDAVKNAANDTDRIKATFAAAKGLASNKYLTAKSIAGATTVKVRAALSDGEIMAISDGDRKDALNLDSDVESFAFYPTYVRGNNIHGVVIYVEKVDDAESVDDFLKAYKYKNAQVPGLTDDELDKEIPVGTQAYMNDTLTMLKSASKKLKSFSDARMKDLDAISKAVDKEAKKASGFSFFNRLRDSEVTHIRLFAAANFVASIFAYAKFNRAILHSVAVHMDMYEEA